MPRRVATVDRAECRTGTHIRSRRISRAVAVPTRVVFRLRADGTTWALNGSVSNAVGFTLSGHDGVGSFPFNAGGRQSGSAASQPFRVRAIREITTTRLPDGVNGQPYNQSVNATSSHVPLTWKLLSNTGAEVTSGAGLPTGLTLSSGGVVSGTPTVSGFYSFNVRVRDSLNQSAIAFVSLFIP